MSIDRKGKTGRRPGPGGSREVILEAARARFAANGYDGATLRAIAKDAGVDPGLIRHFFGDKEALFAATLTLPDDFAREMAAQFAAGRDGMGERIARHYLGVWEAEQTGPALIALTRTAFGHDQAMDRFRDFIVSVATRDIVQYVRDDRPLLRLNLAMSQLLSVALSRHVVRTAPAVEATFEELVGATAPIVEHLLFDEI
ncbi:TetR/AcrR family transcriptional regulator [Isoptericola sp. NPDC055881]